MTLSEDVEQPARRVVRWLFDVLVVLVAGAATIPYLAHHHVHPGIGTVLAVVVVVLPLLVRRLWPVPVFAWMIVTSAAVSLWNRDAIAGFALLIAIYTVASIRPRRDTIVCTAAIEVVMLVAVFVNAGGDGWSNAIFLTGMIAAAAGLGLYAGTRRSYLLELRDRAARLEREKDQQVALAAAAERARIAREMHDIVAHHLTVMVALSDGAIAASARSPERGVDAMRRVSSTGRQALSDTRRLLGVLRSDEADADGPRRPLPHLGELDELIDQVRAAGLPTTYEVQGAADDLAPGVQLTVYRLVQEALTNTLKHGGSGAHASVRLQHLSDELRIQIDDDGAGAGVAAPPGVGGGLTGMRERVHAFGGELQSGPRQVGGWRVSARLRLDDAVDA